MAIFIIAFFAPLWSTLIASNGQDSLTQQYDSIQVLVMGVYNLAFILPALIFLILGLKYRTSYIVSIIVSTASVIFMCVWAFGAGK